MVEVAVDILVTSVPIIMENLRYKVKTWWTQVDVDAGENVKSVKLPDLPMIEHYYKMNGKETTVFVEMWYRNPDLFPEGAMRFLGMAKHRIDEQLKNPSCNPSVEWLEIYDPIEDIIRGRMLLKVDAKFLKIEKVPLANLLPVLPQNSSYFNQSSSHSLETKNKVSSAFSSSVESLKKKSDLIQDKEFKIYQQGCNAKNSGNHETSILLHKAAQLLKSHESSKRPDNRNASPLPSDLDLEIAKVKLDFAVRDREMSQNEQELKKIQIELALSRKACGLPRFGEFSPIQKKSFALPEFGELSPIQKSFAFAFPGFGELSPIHKIQTPPGRKSSLNGKIWSSGDRQTSSSSSNQPTSESEVDEVIQLLNESRNVILNQESRTGGINCNSEHSNKAKNNNVPEGLQIQYISSPDQSNSKYKTKTRHIEYSPAKKHVPVPISKTRTGFNVEHLQHQKTPMTSSKYDFIQGHTSTAHILKSKVYKINSSASSTNSSVLPPVSGKCAAKFSFN